MVIFRVVDTLVLQSLNPLEHGVFQDVFGDDRLGTGRPAGSVKSSAERPA